MFDIINITAPIFLVIGIGYLAVRMRIVGVKQTQGMGIFVLNIALPALFSQAIATRSFYDIILTDYLFIYAIGSLIAFGVGLLITRIVWHGDYISAAINAMGLSFSNSAFIGYPALAMVIGSTAAVPYLSMNIFIENFIILPLLLIIVELSKHSRGSIVTIFSRIFKNLLRNPLILALIISMSVSLLHIPIPQMVLKTTSMLSAAAAPVALFVIGASLYGLKIHGNIQIITFISIGKVALVPFVMLLVSYFIPDTEPQHILAAILFASLPVATSYAIIGQSFGYLQRTSAIVFMSTALSFFTISAVLLIWKMTLGFQASSAIAP